MAEMEIPGTLIRVLGVIGGRKLVKSVESMAAAIARFNKDVYVRSDGNLVELTLKDKKATIEVVGEKPQILDNYYAYQDGKAIVKGDEDTLERIKTTLIELVPFRKAYLLGMYSPKQLKRYGIDIAYIDSLEEKVSSLRIR